MILQRDERALPAIQEYGCYYMSILFLANKLTNIPLGFPFINDFYERCEERVFIKDNFIQDPAAIFHSLGMDVIYLGHINSEYICKPDELEILHFIYQDKHHFLPGDGHGQPTYDPWGCSKTVQTGELKNKRVFKLISPDKYKWCL